MKLATSALLCALLLASCGSGGSRLASDTTEATTTSTTDGTTTTTATTVMTPRPVPTTIGPQRKCMEATGESSPSPTNWESRWQTQPAPNDPATIKACVDDITPAVGQVVHVTIVGDDPDAVIVDEECGWHVEWGDIEPGNLCRDYIGTPTQAQATPVEERGHIERAAMHAYTAAGSFKLLVSVTSSKYEGWVSPYSSYVAVTFPISVHR